ITASGDPTPARSRCGAQRLALLARATGASPCERGPHPRSLALRRSKTRSPRAGRRRFSLRAGTPPPLARPAALPDSLSPRPPPRAGHTRFSLRAGTPPPLARAAALKDSLSSRGPQALLPASGDPTPARRLVTGHPALVARAAGADSCCG